MRASEGDTYSVRLRPNLFATIQIIEAEVGYTFVLLNQFSNSPLSACPSADVELLGSESGKKYKMWFKEEIPPSFHFVCHRDLSPAIRAIRGPIGTSVYQNSKQFTESLLSKWRMIYDREKFFSELAAERATLEKSQADQATARKKKLSWEFLLNEKLFTNFSQLWNREQMAAVRAIFRGAIKDLRADEDRSIRRKILKRIVDQLNDLEEHEEFIETEAREMFVERIGELAKFVGISNKNEALTGHRDW